MYSFSKELYNCAFGVNVSRSFICSKTVWLGHSCLFSIRLIVSSCNYWIMFSYLKDMFTA